MTGMSLFLVSRKHTTVLRQRELMGSPPSINCILRSSRREFRVEFVQLGLNPRIGARDSAGIFRRFQRATTKMLHIRLRSWVLEYLVRGNR